MEREEMRSGWYNNARRWTVRARSHTYGWKCTHLDSGGLLQAGIAAHHII
jgi:hypothetical protein